MDWGLPDWRDPSSYTNQNGTPDSWSLMQWRWEFFRRREDLRQAFNSRAQQTYEEYVEMYSNPSWRERYGDVRILKPDEPGFTAQAFLSDDSVSGIPNPRISAQPTRAIFSSDGYLGGNVGFYYGAQEKFARIGIKEYEVAVKFDLSKPIREQIEVAELTLANQQIALHGRKLSEATACVQMAHLSSSSRCARMWRDFGRKPEMLGNLSAGTEQSARDTWKQARELCFNF